MIDYEDGVIEKADCGIRLAGSAYSRPRYQLQDLSGPWYQSTHLNSPQLNLFFRGDYGKAEIRGELFKRSPLDRFESIRLRSGKNDWSNPFVIDELARRLHAAMGQPSALGNLVNLYVNGEFKRYYNPCERYDERFFQEHFETDAQWDIISHGGVSEGSAARWNALFDYLGSHDLSNPTNYAIASTLVDVPNFIDYIILNAYGATWDWPHNNWYAAAPTNGPFGFYVWDAEGAFGNTGRSYAHNTFTSDLQSGGARTPQLFRALYASDVFRMQFADRVHGHFFGDGAMVDSHIAEEFDTLATELDPVMQVVRGAAVSRTRMANWIANRRPIFFDQLRDQGLWTDVEPPVLGRDGGHITNGFVVTVFNNNDGGTVYYTLDGTDPRAPGGTAAGEAYGDGVALMRTALFKSRVLKDGAWSPLTQAIYLSDLPPLALTELMIDPVGGSDHEFVELRNMGTNAIDLTPLAFVQGITFDFSEGAVSHLAPGEYLLIAKDLDAFIEHYGTNGTRIAGDYGGSLANEGETLVLADDTLGPILSITYDDSRGWPPEADGAGHSLVPRVLVDQHSALDHPANWRASAFMGGSPGQPDPEPVRDLVLNELAAHTDYADPSHPDYDSNDWIEMLNVTDDPINLAHWCLSDDPADPRKWALPTNLTLAAGELISFDEISGFHTPITNGFGLNKAGEQLVLSHLPPGAPGRVADAIKFKGQASGTSLGRYPDGGAYWHAMPPSRGAPNLPPTQTVAISRVMYHPAPTIQYPIENTSNEYVEILNPTAGTVALWSEAGPWRLTGGVDYSFPPDTTLPPGRKILIVPFDPADTEARFWFADMYGSTAGVSRILGPWSRKLSDRSERVALEQSQAGDLPGESNSWIVVDEVRYFDRSPWPSEPDGTGPPLQRIDVSRSGNDPGNWEPGPDPFMRRLYWRFNDAGGLLASDASGHGNAGSLLDLATGNGDGNTPPSWVAGHRDGALLFDGSDDAVRTDADLIATYPFTVMAWVKTAKTAGTGCAVYLGNPGHLFAHYALGIEDGRAMARVMTSPAVSVLARGATPIADGQWHHLAVVFDADTSIHIHVDGEEDGSLSPGMPYIENTTRITAGIDDRSVFGLQEPWSGAIDELQIFALSLGAGRIATEAQAGPPEDRDVRRHARPVGNPPLRRHQCRQRGVARRLGPRRSEQPGRVQGRHRPHQCVQRIGRPDPPDQRPGRRTPADSTRDRRRVRGTHALLPHRIHHQPGRRNVGHAPRRKRHTRERRAPGVLRGGHQRPPLLSRGRLAGVDAAHGTTAPGGPLFPCSCEAPEGLAPGGAG